IYERFRTGATGALTRSDAWWSYRVLADIEAWRGGKSMMRYAIHEEGGIPTGYAMYRQKDNWEDFETRSEVSVEELITLTPEAHLGLWSFLTNIDLFPRVDHWNHPIDDPLGHMVTDHRRLRRTLVDGLWVRLMDVERALEARHYEWDGSILIEVVDQSRPETSGTYRLAVEAGTGSCRRVSDPAQVSISADVLGHLYLGGGDALSMASAGRVEGNPVDVELLHRLFHTSSAPWCPEVF
ncbi:MAG TPA: sterol carrier protein domain-containing protein, partial [Acidimicrobiia bacterium]